MVMRLLDSSRLPLLLLATLVACAEPTVAPPAEPTAVGRAAWERQIEIESGARLTTEQLAAMAGEAYDTIEARMDRLASGLTGDDDWRDVFVTLRDRHPPDAEGVLDLYRREVARAAEFASAHDLLTVPPEELEVVEAANPIIRRSFPLALYIDGKLGVTTSATAEADPSYLANHCYVCVPPLAVHEAYPGHHVSFWQMARKAPSLDVTAESEDDGARLNMFFLEGWALYSELLMLEQGYYEGRPQEELGAWRSLLHRALRARIDPLLHSGEIEIEEAVELYRRDLLMTEDAARTEVRRHLDLPTNKATYFVGLLQILELREKVEAGAAARGESFDLRCFHDRLLGQPEPFPEIARRRFGIELASSPPLRLPLLEPVATAG
jgi:uncharacterized protein (DUF885 family)